MGATDASVLRKPNAAIRIEMTCLDLIGCVLYQSAKFLPLLLRDCCSQILNFGSMLPHKNNQCHLGNASDPRIANQLRIERKQTFRAIWVATGRGLPVNEAAHTVYLTDRVEIGNKFAASRQRLQKFDLEILTRVADANAIILRKPLEQMYSLMH